MNIIALDLGGTRIKAGILSDGKILANSLIDSHSSGGLIARLPAIENEIFSLIQKCNLSIQEIAGIGISSPGIVDSVEMKILSINDKYNDAVGFDFRYWAKSVFGLSVFIENDARAALLGEWQYGAGKDCDNLVMLTFGTGIGGATLIEGNLLRGKHYQAGCLAGHFTINYKGAKCNCGNIGCGEQEASSHILSELAKNHPLFNSSKLFEIDTIDYQNIFYLSQQNDALASEIVKHSIDVWSAIIISQIHAYDPEKVILGGGVMRSAAQILPRLIKNVNERAWTPWGKVEIVEAIHHDFAALYGMEYLLHHNSKIK